MANNINKATELESLLERSRLKSVDEFGKVLAETYDYIIKKLARPPEDSRRLQAMLRDVVKRIQDDYPVLADLVRQDMAEWSELAYNVQAGALAGTLPEGVAVATTFASLSETATKRILDPNLLIQGETISQHTKALGEAKALQIRGIIASGITRGQPNTEIISNIKQAIDAIPARNVEPLVRTAIAEATQQANMEAFSQLGTVVDYAIYQAVMDTRTTPYCAETNGTTWKRKPDESYAEFRERVLQPINGRVPRTPTHWNCRSRLLFTTKGFYNEWKQAKPQAVIRDTTQTRKNITKHRDGTTSTKFRLKGIEKISEKNPQFEFANWFDNQASAEYKRFYLGARKYKLYEQGNLSYKQMVDLRSNKILTIDEIRGKI